MGDLLEMGDLLKISTSRRGEGLFRDGGFLEREAY